MNSNKIKTCSVSFYEKINVEKVDIYSFRISKDALIKYRKDSLKLLDKDDIIYNSIANDNKYNVPFNNIYDLAINKEALDYLEKNNLHFLKPINMKNATEDDINYYNNYINEGLSMSNGSLIVIDKSNKKNNYYIISQEEYDTDNVRKGIIHVPRNLYLLHLLYKHNYKLLDNDFVKISKNELNDLLSLFDEFDINPLNIKDINDRQMTSKIKYRCERDKKIIKYLK